MNTVQMYLARLRTRSYDEKMALATGAGFAVAIVLFGVWIVSWVFNPPSLGTSTASVVSGLEQAQKAQEQLQSTVQELSAGYRNAEAILRDIQAMDAPHNPATANFVQLHSDEFGNVVAEQIDVRAQEGSIQAQ